MRIHEIVTEAYFDSIKASGNHKYVEVFVNPERKEIQDIPAIYGYRLLLDLHNKKFYAADGQAIHSDMWEQMDFQVPYEDVQKGDQSQYFTFSAGQYTGTQFVQLISDTFTGEIYYYAARDSRQRKEEILNNVNAMLEQDWSWCSTWCDPAKAKQIVIDLKQQFEDDLQYANS